MKYTTDSGVGLVTLLPEAAIMRREIERRISDVLDLAGYLPLYTPHIGNVELFEKSGHYPYYKDSMYPLIGNPICDSLHALKPMSCPMHIDAYASEPRSYKDLPIKYCEFGTVYRHEASGSVNGLFRLRGFTQDDGHIFCTEEQVHDVVKECIDLVEALMKEFPIGKLSYRLSTRGHTDNGKFTGMGLYWHVAEKTLREILQAKGEFVEDVGGAAFYGPKIDFIAKDSLGREWQLGTVQLDFQLPARFKLAYTPNGGPVLPPVLIHRALLGSIERFIGILLDNFEDQIPLWLKLKQVAVIPVHKGNLELARTATKYLRSHGIRAVTDEEEAPLRAKIANAINDKIPLRIVLGDRDQVNYLEVCGLIAQLKVTIEEKDKKHPRYLNNFVKEFKSKEWDYIV